MADACGVSRRTVFRDVKSLKQAGVPVEFDEGAKRYRIDGAHYLTPTNLTLVEALAVVLLAERHSRSGEDALLTAAGAAADKIRAGLPAAMQDRLDEVEDAVEFRPPPTNPLLGQGDVHDTLLNATLEQRVVSIEYDCFTEFDRYPTELSPYHLLFQDRSWYVIGHSAYHEAVRTFNVGRVKNPELRAERFDRPEEFTLAGYLGNAWRLIPDDGPDEEVHLRFTPLVAKNVAEVMWHATQRTELRTDGVLDYRVTVSGLREIVWWVLGYGDHVEVVGPRRLRRMVAQRLRAAAERYHDV